MSVRTEPATSTVDMPDTVDEMVIDPGWQAQCDQVRAALHRTWLPVNGGYVRNELTAERLGGAR